MSQAFSNERLLQSIYILIYALLPHSTLQIIHENIIYIGRHTYIHILHGKMNLTRRCSRHATHHTRATHIPTTQTHTHLQTARRSTRSIYTIYIGGEQACELRLNGRARASIGLVSLRKPIIPAHTTVCARARGECAVCCVLLVMSARFVSRSTVESSALLFCAVQSVSVCLCVVTLNCWWNIYIYIYIERMASAHSLARV